MGTRINTDFVARLLQSEKGNSEESVVTFLAGLVASDGVVLASDMRHTRNDEVRSTFNAEKNISLS